MHNTLDLSIILVNWNSLALTQDALESLRSHTEGVSYEVIVIDNGSTLDQSCVELPSRFPWITFVRNSSNLGFGKANNIGIQKSRGRYVLLLNNDTVQTENAFGKSVQYMDSYPDVGVLGILHYNADGAKTVQTSAFFYPNPWREVLSLLTFNSQWSAAQTPAPIAGEQNVDWVCGSFFLMRRECLSQVGVLDERFFIYDEDIDWCRRAIAAGWIVRFWPVAAMIHVGASARPFMKDKTFVHFRSRLSYYRKHHSMLAAAAFYLAMLFRLTLSVLGVSVRFMLRTATHHDIQVRYSRFMQFLTLRSGKLGG